MCLGLNNIPGCSGITAGNGTKVEVYGNPIFTFKDGLSIVIEPFTTVLSCNT